MRLTKDFLISAQAVVHHFQCLVVSVLLSIPIFSLVLVFIAAGVNWLETIPFVLSIVLFPAVTGVPAFVVALVAAAGLARMRRRSQ